MAIEIEHEHANRPQNRRGGGRKAEGSRLDAGRSTNLRASNDVLIGLFETMFRIRSFEERAAELFQRGVIKGTAHSYAGQEAIAAGACASLTRDDYIGSYHRGHGHCIAKGADVGRMMAELMGRETGYCRGLGGSMHIADLELNILGANGIVGATMPLGAGAALAAKLKGTEQVAIAFFGDGAANQGVFHEALNLAAVWKLPMIFICENNQYALNTAFHKTTAVKQVSTRAVAYDVPGRTIDGNDAVEVYAVVAEAIERARGGHGPSLIEAMTWRWGPHSMRANLIEPRTDADMAAWRARDPIDRIKEVMAGQPGIDPKHISEIETRVLKELDDAVTFASNSAEPTIDILETSVCAPHNDHQEPGAESERLLSYSDAINEAFHQEMEQDSSVMIMGEDIALTGGIFQVTKGLADRFGYDRVRDTPISEATFCGTAVGAAIAGLRPIVEIQIFDFVALMMDMIVNQAAKFRFMNGGRAKVPLVIRGPQGGGIRLAAQHSQSLEAWFAHVPGLVVLAPSTPYDAKGLMIAAIRDDNPVIFLEHKMLYLSPPGPVPEQSYAIPIGKADVKRSGTDVTIVATLLMVSRALSAATILEREGISVEVIDPRTIRPLDEATILASVRKTNRLIVVHEAWQTGGFGAEVSAMVMEKGFDWLDAPVVRVAAPDVPMPFNDRLETAVIPTQERIISAVRELLGRA
jgi:2-oxoisovalerate dehydrogenase E1 component